MSQDNEPGIAGEEDRQGRKFAVSANRGRSHHRIRYVESGGAAVDPEECVFCEVTPSLEDGGDSEPEDPGPSQKKD